MQKCIIKFKNISKITNVKSYEIPNININIRHKK